MELALGGDLFDRIKEKGHSITESYISSSFHTALKALQQIHQARYLHRDLKVENLIAISKEDNSPIKLIDFGMMVELPEGRDKLIDPQKPGTPCKFMLTIKNIFIAVYIFFVICSLYSSGIVRPGYILL